MIDRTLFNGEHCLFRDNLKRFLTREVLPFHSQWEERGYVGREIWNRAGSEGFLCPTVPEEYGGSGGDQLFSISVIEEIAIAGASGLGWSLHSDVVAPYILSYGTEMQMKHYQCNRQPALPQSADTGLRAQLRHQSGGGPECRGPDRGIRRKPEPTGGPWRARRQPYRAGHQQAVADSGFRARGLVRLSRGRPVLSGASAIPE